MKGEVGGGGGGALLSRIMGLWFVCFLDVTACVFGCGLDFQLVLPLFDGRNCCRMFDGRNCCRCLMEELLPLFDGRNCCRCLMEELLPLFDGRNCCRCLMAGTVAVV